MKKAIIAIIALIIIAGGAYAIFHESSGPAANDGSKSAGSNRPAQTAKTSGQDDTAAVNNAVLTTKTNPSLGQYLTDPDSKALYTYNADTKGVSNCTGSCLSAWPAYVDEGSTTGLPAGVDTIKRTDNGQIQYTYKGLPLYYFVSDSPGQVTGDGVENFSVAKP
jgi:predicted lipoprotein with Yx(FWY)xxD motif